MKINAGKQKIRSMGRLTNLRLFDKDGQLKQTFSGKNKVYPRTFALEGGIIATNSLMAFVRYGEIDSILGNHQFAYTVSFGNAASPDLDSNSVGSKIVESTWQTNRDVSGQSSSNGGNDYRIAFTTATRTSDSTSFTLSAKVSGLKTSFVSEGNAGQVITNFVTTDSVNSANANYYMSHGLITDDEGSPASILVAEGDYVTFDYELSTTFPKINESDTLSLETIDILNDSTFSSVDYTLKHIGISDYYTLWDTTCLVDDNAAIGVADDVPLTAKTSLFPHGGGNVNITTTRDGKNYILTIPAGTAKVTPDVYNLKTIYFKTLIGWLALEFDTAIAKSSDQTFKITLDLSDVTIENV